MKNQEYYLGLDIGTDSVGYAATDREYNLLKKGGEPMWGVHLFDAAQLNTERRGFRVGRRRLDRRKQRVSLVQELFASTIAEVDPRFFIRLQQSALLRADAEEPYALFNDPSFTDQDYHRRYPTIHHLIHELMTDPTPHDVRLVYLACAWLVAHRGHFLSDISKENVAAVSDFSAVYHDLVDYILALDSSYVIPWSQENIPAVGAVLQQRISITAKLKKLLPLLFSTGKAPKKCDNFPFNPEVLIKSLCGSEIKAANLFMQEAYDEISSFSLGSDDDKLADVIDKLGDDAGLILRLKAIYDWSILVGILNGHSTISEAKVAVYDQHHEDLVALKAFIRKYAPDKYDTLFHEITSLSYTGYVYHFPKDAEAITFKKTKKEDFSDTLKSIVKSIKPDETDLPFYEDMMERLSIYAFLPKQKDSENRVIPYQLYWHEMNTLLTQASAYLPFLSQQDDTGLSVKDKLLSIFLFRVPYYVGPLNKASSFAWVVRKPEKILPWNFSQIVDEDASEEAFINRMTNSCTYLPDQKVLPKDSLLYHRFTVLNEINNIRVNDTPIPVEIKQKMYEQLFLTNKKVTRAKIIAFLKKENCMRADGDLLTGIDEQIHSDLRPQQDFARLLASGRLTEEQVEEVITRITYTEDTMRLKKYLAAHFPALPQKDIDYIARLKYKDFGRLSAYFLTSFEGVCKETGEITTIMKELWNTNRNLMELLSDRYTFAEKLETIRNDWYAAHPLTLDEQLEELRLSNAVKRPVLRALQITSEVVKATGKAPEKIFVEVTRGASAEQKNKRTVSRLQRLRDLYAQCDSEDVRLLEQQLDAMGDNADNQLRSDALFLYYLQLGKCLYTGKAIDLTQLKSGAYNIEHIYPQSKVKDDSIINNRILVDSVANGAKKDTYPVDASIREQMTPLWQHLNKIGLMSDEKLHRLTRTTSFSEEELMGFINRQLTETSQSVKATATILARLYPDTKIVYAKASLTSDFRQEFDLLKSRTFNDLHHAKDAYLNIVTGNVYDMKFSSRWFSLDQQYTLNVRPMFEKPVVCGGITVWKGETALAQVRKTVTKNNAHMTRYAFCRHGGFFNQMPVKAAPDLIPRKQSLPTEKYGGYDSVKASSFMLVRFIRKKKPDIMFYPIKLINRASILTNEETALSIITEDLKTNGFDVNSVSLPLGLTEIKINTTLSLDGFKVCLTGGSLKDGRLGLSPSMSFVAPANYEKYIKRLERLNERSKARHFIYNAAYDYVTPEDNLKLYDIYTEKLQNSIYIKRPGLSDTAQLLKNNRDIFAGLDVVAQTACLLNIHLLFGRASDGIDLSLLCGSKRSCTCRFSLCISGLRKNYSSITLVNSSTSGLWSISSENLFDML